ncbi:hypothetical protein MRX96_038508 [Rhipicephalus microplus]
MMDRKPEVRQSTLKDKYKSEDSHGGTQRRSFSPEMPMMTRNESSMELATLATAVQMMTQLLQRQMGAPRNSIDGANKNAMIQIMAMSDLAMTLPTFCGTDNDSLKITSVENMHERCSWKNLAKLNAGISGLCGRAAAWHCIKGMNLKDWHTWVAALRKEFNSHCFASW